MNKRILHNAIRQFLTLPVVSPITAAASGIEMDGALPNLGSLVAALTLMNQFNIADAAVNFQTSAAASITLTPLQNLYQKLTNGGAVVVTLDSAYNVVNLMPGAFNGQTFPLTIFSSGAGTVATPTLSDTAITLSGTTSVVAGNARSYRGQITQLTSILGMSVTSGTTFTSIAQVGSTNNFTVTLGTNAIVPAVGTLINLTVTAGTLPSGWYPINLVTSATSFVIATPPGTVWTATAAAVGTGTVAPATYSPLLTLTAMQSVAAVV